MKVSIIGAYQTVFGEHWDLSLSDLISQSIVGVLKAAGIKKTVIQSVYIGNMLSPLVSDQNHLGSLVSQILDNPLPCTHVEAACASGGVAVAQAVSDINSGLYDCVLVIGAEKMTDMDNGDITKALMGAASKEERDAGLTFPGLYALMARSYLEKYGREADDLAWISVKNHYHASLNPKAQYPHRITVDQVRGSGMVADPLRLLDCSSICDGAAAVLLASSKFADKLSGKYPSIIASAQASDSLSLTSRKNLYEIKSTQLAAISAYKQAGIGPGDINLAEIHDCFTIAEAIALEDLQFFAKGEGSLSAQNKQTWLTGRLPVNLSGGLKACGHPVGATGVKQLVEVCCQLSGQAGDRQAKNHDFGLTQNIGGTGGTSVVHIIQSQNH